MDNQNKKKQRQRARNRRNIKKESVYATSSLVDPLYGYLNQNRIPKLEDKQILLNPVIENLKQYNFKEIFLWLQITASHPSNQKFAGRFDLLNSILLSIPTCDFINNKFNRASFENLFLLLEDEYEALFINIEDYEPLDQLKLIPYYFEGKKYYFYYGVYESPFEELENFDNVYLKNCVEKDSLIFKTIRSIFKVSLDFQTSLLDSIVKLQESKIVQDKVYIPSQDFFNNIVKFFKIEQKYLKTLKEMPKLKSGDFNCIQQELSNKILDYNIYDTFIINSSDNETFFLWPGRHIDVLHTFAFNFINYSKDKVILSQIQKNCQRQLFKICKRFFTIRGSLVGLYSQNTTENLLKKLDYAAVSDGGKIILFKLLTINSNETIDEKFNKASLEMKQVVDDLKKGGFIGLRYADNPEKIPAIPTEVSELYTIYIIPRLTLEPFSFGLSDLFDNEYNFIVTLSDTQRVFELLKSPLSFIKFLRDDYNLRKKTHIMCFEFLDRFICYIDNKNSYFQQGKPLSGAMFQPHSWSEYYSDKLYKKSKESIYGLMEKYFPDCYNDVEDLGDGIYGFNSTVKLDASIAIEFNKSLFIFFLPANGYTCTGEELDFSSFLGHFYAYYFKKFEKQLLDFLTSYGVLFGEIYGTTITPITYIKRNNINYLLPFVSDVNKQNPLEIITGKVKETMDLRTAVIFDSQEIISIFSVIDNQGEKKALCKFLISLIRYFDQFDKNCNLEEDVLGFINKIMPTGPRAFSLGGIALENPKAEKYRQHRELQDSDIAAVNRLIAECIANKRIDPGEYSGKKAIEILEFSFDFISNVLENELEQFNSNMIYHLLEQLDYVQFDRIRYTINAGLTSSNYTEYNVEEKFISNYDEISKASIAIKYLFKNFIKLTSHGKKAITGDLWDYLLALSDAAINISWSIDFLRFGLRKHTIIVTDLYEIQHQVDTPLFDTNHFAKIEAKSKIASIQDTYLNSELKNDKEKKSKISYLDGLNAAFLEQYGFKFFDMATALYALGKYNGPSLSPNKINNSN